MVCKTGLFSVRNEGIPVSRRWLSALFFVSVVGCSTPVPTDNDAGPISGLDAANVDAGKSDSGGVDAGAADAGKGDAGDVDAGKADAGEKDAGPPDAGAGDPGETD